MNELSHLLDRMQHHARGGREPIELVMSEDVWRRLKQDALADSSVVVAAPSGAERASVGGVPVHFAEGGECVQIVYEAGGAREMETWTPRT